MYPMSIFLIACIAFMATFIGGWCAIRFKDKLHLILGFSAGAVIAVAFFDLIPEALELGEGVYSSSFLLGITAIGFLVYLVLDRWVFFHSHVSDHENCDTEDHQHRQQKQKSFLGASSLCFHSFLDGIAVGLAFQVSVAVGVIVAVAVIVHDFSDGVNTVGMIMRSNGDRRTAIKWLLVDALAPVLGIIVTMFFAVPMHSLAIILSLFAGFFLYIGASDLIPESHHAHPKLLTTVMTIVGAVVLYIAIQLAGI